ncbi:MAG: tyrosine-type recombinase/integrase [Pyrinomonadaceae bacterium]|nr:tyrosine-type recombinase/integrase [Pyrinomonadaceae bacterium]
MPVQRRRNRWHYAFCIRGVRYRGALPEARTKFEAEKAETKVRQEVYEGRYGRPTGEKDFVAFVEAVYKPWAIENKRSFKSNDKYKLPVICESKCFKGKTFAQISPFLIEKYKKERREAVMESGSTRKPSTINRELGLISKIFSLAIKYGVTYSNPCREIPWLPENNNRIRYLLDEEEPRPWEVLNGRRTHLRPLVTLAIGTGMRRGDQLNLRWAKVDFQRDVIYVPNSKTGKDYSVPMNADVRDLMGHSDPQTTRRYTHATDRAKRATVEAVRYCARASSTTQERLPELAAVTG